MYFRGNRFNLEVSIMNKNEVNEDTQYPIPEEGYIENKAQRILLRTIMDDGIHATFQGLEEKNVEFLERGFNSVPVDFAAKIIKAYAERYKVKISEKEISFLAEKIKGAGEWPINQALNAVLKEGKFPTLENMASTLDFSYRGFKKVAKDAFIIKDCNSCPMCSKEHTWCEYSYEGNPEGKPSFPKELRVNQKQEELEEDDRNKILSFKEGLSKIEGMEKPKEYFSSGCLGDTDYKNKRRVAAKHPSFAFTKRIRCCFTATHT